MENSSFFALILALVFVGCKKDPETPDPTPGPTPTPQGLVDIDGNEYDTVTIGSQVWMTENLRVRRWRNGDSIPFVSEATAWTASGSSECCVYNNDPAKDP